MRILLAFLIALPALAGEINTLTPEEKADGWELLFNGHDLANFRAYGSDKPPGPQWKIEDGILRKEGGKPGPHIITKAEYRDFTFAWEWRMSPKGNSGIKYLVDEKRPIAPGPEYQMIDDLGHKDGKIGPHRQTGSLYDILPPSAEKILKPVGEWNSSRITIKGQHVEHWLNGALILSYELESPELKAAIANSKFSKVKGFDAKSGGHIMLTDHFDECSFRNLKIRAEKAD